MTPKNNLVTNSRCSGITRIEDLTRREFMFSAVGAALLIACGDDDEASEPSGAGTGSSDFPVTIEHKLGSTTIESRPDRVVTVGWSDQDYLLALGVVPVMTRAWFDDYYTYPWVSSVLDGATPPTIPSEIDYEAITAEQPDLILAIFEEIDQDIYDRLSQIAPTVIQSGQYEDGTTPWDVQTLTTGRALGKTAEAQALVDQVTTRLARARQEHPEFAGKTLVVDYGPSSGGHYLIPDGDSRRAIFDALGFAAQSESGDISEEQLHLLDRDVLFVNGGNEEELVASSLFANLAVVNEGRTLYTSFDTSLAGALSYSGPRALLYAFDVLIPQLANAADNDPATEVANPLQ